LSQSVEAEEAGANGAIGENGIREVEEGNELAIKKADRRGENTKKLNLWKLPHVHPKCWIFYEMKLNLL
jgi:hypothetical protein